MAALATLSQLIDGNGWSHSFLIENGAILHSLWNAQAQTWDSAQLLPAIDGVSALQVLLVPSLWPTDSNGHLGSKPGIVVAYRVGLGSSALIYASFGQWGSDGQLGWSQPLALNPEQPGSASFSLVAEGKGFTLVVQHQLDSSPAADSDLYALPFAIRNPAQPQLVDALSGTSVGPLTPAVPSTTRPSPDPQHSSASVALPGWPASGLGTGLPAAGNTAQGGDLSFLQGMARYGTDLLNPWPGASQDSRAIGPIPSYRGLLGLSAPADAGNKDLSSAKLTLTAGAPGISFGGQLQTRYGYGLTSSHPGQLTRPLLGVTMDQSAGLDSHQVAFTYPTSSASLQLDAVSAAGSSWQQSLTSTAGVPLPNWLTPLAGTAYAALEPVTWIALAQAGYDLPSTVAWQQAASASLSVSSTAHSLWTSIYDLQAVATTQTTSHQLNGAAGPFSSQVEARVEARLPLGGLIPLLDYSSTPSSSYTVAAQGSATPFTYAPEAGTTALLPSVSATREGNPVLLGGEATPLQLFTLLPTAAGAINSSATGTGYALTLYNAGTNLTNGPYTQVPILGVSADGRQSSGALASFNVVGGSIDPTSFQISSQGAYLSLPRVGGNGPQSDDLALVLDVVANPLAGLPLVTLNPSLAGAPLQLQTINRIVAVPVTPAAPTPQLNNSPHAHRGIPVQLQADGAAVRLLNPNPADPTVPASVTATVLVSGGVIQQVLLDQPLLFAPVNGATAYTLSLSLPNGTAGQVFPVTPQALGYNNLVADGQFSPQQGLPGAGVYVAAGVSDGLPLTPAMGGAPVQNRVAYVSTSGTGAAALTSVVYLNGSQKDSKGTVEPLASVDPSQLTPGTLYASGTSLSFSAASSPTAIAIVGEGVTGGAGGTTLVAWVESSEVVTPYTTSPSDGSQNLQTYLQALYGNQRINFRILQDGIWTVPDLADLYTPGEGNPANPVVLHDLKALNVANPAAPGGLATLVVWCETSIAAIQGAVATSGTQQANSIPSVIKAGWINPNAQPIKGSSQWDWASLFTDSAGNSTIQTIPWDPGTEVGLAISNLNLASRPMLQGDGSIAANPSISWSQATLPSYRQSVLNDAPIVYLQFDKLERGLHDINIGSVDSIATATSASGRGLNFAIAGALPSSNATAVQNKDGTAVISTGLGTMLRSIRAIAANIPPQDSQGQAGGSTDPAITRFSGTISGTTLTLAAASQGSLAVGDALSGTGISPGTTIVAVNGSNPGAGQGSYSLNTTYSSPLSVAAGTATPVSVTLPYSIEFWAQLQPLSNPNGAGLVALGQPSSTAVGAAIAPSGWLLNSHFVVDRISYQQAAARGLITGLGNNDPNAIYAWQWAVEATGAGTSAMGGTGGANLYSNALLLNNLASGASLEGVNQFLANYNLTAGDLVGLDGLNAATIARAPSTELQVSPKGSLAAIAIDPATAVLNQGLVLQSSLQENSTSSSLNAMFEALWTYQRSTGEAKVQFNRAPSPTTAAPTTAARASTNAETYAGYPLGLALVNGIAVSVNGSGQLVYDIGQGTSLVSQAVGTTVPADLRDGQWHHIVATYLPGQGTTGVATLYVDNHQVAQQGGVAHAPIPANLNDQALLLTNNVGGAIDQLAFYNKALTTSSFSPNSAGQWPIPTSSDALALLAAMGTSIPGQPPVVGTIPGAISQHYAARNVDPSAPPLATYTSGFDAATGSWTQASPLNPLPQPIATQPGSTQAGTPAQDGLVISMPVGSWTSNNWQVTTGSGSKANQLANQFFNPSNRILSGVTVTMAAIGGGTETPITLQLSPDQVLLGDQSLRSMQPMATASSFLYRLPTDTPALTLLIPSDQLPKSPNPVAKQSLKDRYAATASFTFANLQGSVQGTITGKTLTVTGLGGSLAVGDLISGPNILPGTSITAVVSAFTASTGKPGTGKGIYTISQNPSQSITSTTSFTVLGDVTSIAPSHGALTGTIAGNVLTVTSLNGSLEVGDQLTTAPGNTPGVGPATFITGIRTPFSQTTGTGSYTVSQNNVLASTQFTALDGVLDGAVTPAPATANSPAVIGTAVVVSDTSLNLNNLNNGLVLRSASTAAAAHNQALVEPITSFGHSQVVGQFDDSAGNSHGWLAIAQPFATQGSNPAPGRVWIQYTGQSANGTPSTSPAQAPTTWLKALASSSFQADRPNLPLLNNSFNTSNSGGLLIRADARAGWGQQFGDLMLVADVNNDGVKDLVISAPQAHGGGKVLIINGTWIQNNLTSSDGGQILDLSNPNSLPSCVTVLTPAAALSGDNASAAQFGSALAFDSVSQTLWIGAPNYLRQLNPGSNTPLRSEVPIGAVYTYTYPYPNGWDQGVATALTTTAVGSGGALTSTDASGAATTTYWGSRFGSAIASNGTAIAISAPGLQASLVYGGSAAVQQQLGTGNSPTKAANDGALEQIQLPGGSLVPVARGTSLSAADSTAMQNLRALQTDTIASATQLNNQALQTAAVGAVYLFHTSYQLEVLAEGNSPINPEALSQSPSGGATFYGPNPWNTLGATGFGSSLSFADLVNTNSDSILSIGAPQAGGSGAVYLVDTNQPFTAPAASQPSSISAINLGSNQYLAHLASSVTLYGAARGDNVGNGLLNLGDVNQDGYGDLLVQAFNAASGAGSGYVLFGSDQLQPSGSGQQSALISASGSVAPGSIGHLQRADGTSINAPILNALGWGQPGYTGLGTVGAGDVNGDGIPDILLGSGPNGSATITWGRKDLESMTNLQLSRMASNNGAVLDDQASVLPGSLRSVGDFNGDGLGDVISIQPGDLLTSVRLYFGENSQSPLPSTSSRYYTFNVLPGTEVMAAGDMNGDGYGDIALFLDQTVASTGATTTGSNTGSATGILYGRPNDLLPLSPGFGLLAPVGPNSPPAAVTLPGVAVAGGLTSDSPSVIAVGNTLYAAVVGVGAGDTSLWFTQSNDAGNSWTNWTNLSGINAGFAATSSPSLAYFRDQIYLSFVNTSGDLSLASWDPTGNNPATWSTPLRLSDTTIPNFTPAGPWSGIDNGSSPSSPALAINGTTVYMAVQGNGTNDIFWTSSTDGGVNWADWAALPTTATNYNLSALPPSLAVVNGTLYLSYVGGDVINITSLDASNNWSPPYQIPTSATTSWW